ncbi:MAG: ATP-grasp domain-containing protein [Desulfovibrio sp.]|nr:ATP-grasp domain-containing protein [Desulfovibrio sp.]
MKLFEYQAKDAFKDAGVAVPESVLIRDMDELDQAIAKIGLPCVLKAQVLKGGRGKAGLVKVVKDADEARKEATRIFGAPNNAPSILVEQAVDIGRELYLSVTFDPVSATALLIGSAEGGVDIESLAKESPEKITSVNVDIEEGLGSYHINNLVYGMGLKGDVAKKVGKIASALYRVFRDKDASLVEINPLFITKSGDIIAGDGKLIIDDNSLFRQPGYPLDREHFDSDVEYEAAADGIPYLRFDGDIALLCAGSGLTTAVYDLINDAGGSVATYVDFGGANYTRAVRAMELCLETPSKAILVVTFGTIARADVMAEGIVEAMKKLKPDVPIVLRIRGTNEAEAFNILKEAGLENLTDTEEAVRKAVELARSAN